MPIFYPYSEKKQPKELKNLSWLLRHASDVEDMTLCELHQGKAQLRAYTREGMYCCYWESFTLAKEWLNRRCLSHASLVIHPTQEESRA